MEQSDETLQNRQQHSGTIGVTTENIFPVIKKFLYSDHEIFLRELVSNAVDATQKLRTLASFGDFKGKIDGLDVTVTIDKEAGTLTVADHGIGMTEDEVDRYINQIAFSGAEEFLNKFKNDATTIIGHFGLGFYSAFMVAKRVEIRTLSYKEGATAVTWICDGSPSYTMGTCDKTERGTEIILTIDDENRQYLEQSEIDGLLRKYCRFLPVPVVSGGKTVNETAPAWLKKPAELTDDDYLHFYRDLYPDQEDPLFWIHLNVDYPFTLTGILFFPKIKNNIEVAKNRIQLYCNQVYVTDSVEGVVPEFMMLLQGVIDSPDIPLNVSRSYLQSDTAVKKISGYITKKVALRLEDLFKNSRTEFEQKWDDIKLFIEYGMLTDPKFCDAAMKFILLKDTQGRYFTIDEYRNLIQSSQTDKDGTLVILYTTDPTAQHSFIKEAEEKGYDVLVMDGQLDTHFAGLLESRLEKTRLVRVDSDTIAHLIKKDDAADNDGLDPLERDILTTLFQSQIPAVEGTHFRVAFNRSTPDSLPATVTADEYMRRMKEMAALQPGMSFYGELPDSYTLNVNVAQPAVEKITKTAVEALRDKVEPLQKELTEAGEDAAKASEARSALTGIISAYAKGQQSIGQIIDLALLGAGLLKGEPLSRFIRRSASLL